MYLRTARRKNKDGSSVEYLQLAHNHRNPQTGQSTAQIVHSFGRADSLDRDALARLCRSIARVCGLEVREAQGDGGGGLPEEVKLVETRELGPMWVIEALWERLGLGDFLRKRAKASRLRIPYERALLAMVGNRLCEPSSKLGVWDRWLDHVYAPECGEMKLDHFYEAMDFLSKHMDKVEESVFNEVATLFNLDVDLVFYDTTTVSFEIDYADGEIDGHPSGLRRRGHSKDGDWKPQVVVALAVTSDGIPIRSWVLPGNTADVTTIERIKADLRGWRLNRSLFVADAGMNSEENRQELARACGRYVLATRMASVSEIKDDVLTRQGRYQEIDERLSVKEVVVGEGERRRRYFVCKDSETAERQRKHREEVVAFLEAELESHPELDATQQWVAKLRSSSRFGKYLRVTKGKKLALDKTAIKQAEKYDGKWVLQTNDDSITAEDAARAYKSLLVIERCFRSMKTTQIRMKPMYHWVTRRIVSHVKICTLALLIQRVAEHASGRSWGEIRDKLRKLQATQFEVGGHRFWRRNEMAPEVANLLKALKVKPPKQVIGVGEAR